MFPTKRCLTTAMAIGAAVVCFFVCAPCAEEKASVAEQRQAALSIAEFERLHQELQPPKDELWRSIPWQVSIVEGRELAGKQRKPIFVWVASGEPLGCGWNNVVAFRATAFNDASVVKLLRSRFVCVGIAHNGAGRRKDAEGDFARKIIGSGGTLQGLHVIDTAGKLVDYVYDFRPESVLAMLERALKKFEPVDGPPIDFNKKDARFKLPEGGVVVAVTSKVLGGYEPIQAAKGTIGYDMEKAWKTSLGREQLWIRKDEVQALAKDELPETLRKRIVRYHLVDNTRGTPAGWTEADIKKLELTLRRGRFEGYVHLETQHGERGYQATLLGFVRTENGKVTRFDLVAHGQHWGEGAHTPRAPKGKFPLAVAFTLADMRDPLTKLVPDAVRCYADYLR